MFGGKPAFGVKPLATPVIWDRVRNQSLEPGMGVTEGARGYSGGYAEVPTSSGLKVVFERSPNHHAEVSFYKPGEGSKRGLGVPADNETPSPKQAIDSLGEVFKHVKAYVAKTNPASINFSAASDSLQKVYDKVAPLMAKQLGGTLDQTTAPGFYTIRFTK